MCSRSTDWQAWAAGAHGIVNSHRTPAACSVFPSTAKKSPFWEEVGFHWPDQVQLQCQRRISRERNVLGHPPSPPGRLMWQLPPQEHHLRFALRCPRVINMWVKRLKSSLCSSALKRWNVGVIVSPSQRSSKIYTSTHTKSAQWVGVVIPASKRESEDFQVIKRLPRNRCVCGVFSHHITSKSDGRTARMRSIPVDLCVGLISVWSSRPTSDSLFRSWFHVNSWVIC